MQAPQPLPVSSRRRCHAAAAMPRLVHFPRERRNRYFHAVAVDDHAATYQKNTRSSFAMQDFRMAFKDAGTDSGQCQTVNVTASQVIYLLMQWRSPRAGRVDYFPASTLHDAERRPTFSIVLQHRALVAAYAQDIFGMPSSCRCGALKARRESHFSRAAFLKFRRAHCHSLQVSMLLPLSDHFRCSSRHDADTRAVGLRANAPSRDRDVIAGRRNYHAAAEAGRAPNGAGFTSRRASFSHISPPARCGAGMRMGASRRSPVYSFAVSSRDRRRTTRHRHFLIVGLDMPRHMQARCASSTFYASGSLDMIDVASPARYDARQPFSRQGGTPAKWLSPCYD